MGVEREREGKRRGERARERETDRELWFRSIKDKWIRINLIQLFQSRKDINPFHPGDHKVRETGETHLFLQ